MIHIEVDDHEVMDALNQLISQLDDLTPAMKDVSGELEKIATTAFEEQASPAGIPWPDLSDVTKEQRAESGHWPGDILKVTGDLASSIQSDYGPDFAVASTNAPHAATHQFGAKQGQFGRGTFKTREGSVPIPWGDIPPRPFLGLSDEGKEEILNIFTQFLDGAF
ncbi:phage virion morphogenesis protein [Methylohalobius crimeensis]|uniref:phage virion morphogenesis protein n=1 Tax=Methylohalobius crimeensis TaxID=244365 RepID=UPI0003B47D72|nr:phage virion morphogenesis protein [Methylohalobius crimeensis]